MLFISGQLLTGAVGLLFAPLAPLVPLAAAILFWISHVAYKYLLMYVFVTRIESGGVSTTPLPSQHIINTYFLAVVERCCQSCHIFCFIYASYHGL